VGYEVAGEVTALGRSAAGFAAGNKVIALTRFGGYSSHVSVRQEQVFALPPGLDFAQGAALPVTYLTAYQSDRIPAFTCCSIFCAIAGRP
jgi:NADPH:quinone reductase-like Zn-dependent oxidoreductase